MTQIEFFFKKKYFFFRSQKGTRYRFRVSEVYVFSNCPTVCTLYNVTNTLRKNDSIPQRFDGRLICVFGKYNMNYNSLLVRTQFVDQFWRLIE